MTTRPFLLPRTPIPGSLLRPPLRKERVMMARMLFQRHYNLRNSCSVVTVETWTGTGRSWGRSLMPIHRVQSRTHEIPQVSASLCSQVARSNRAPFQTMGNSGWVKVCCFLSYDVVPVNKTWWYYVHLIVHSSCIWMILNMEFPQNIPTNICIISFISLIW